MVGNRSINIKLFSIDYADLLNIASLSIFMARRTHLKPKYICSSMTGWQFVISNRTKCLLFANIHYLFIFGYIVEIHYHYHHQYKASEKTAGLLNTECKIFKKFQELILEFSETDNAHYQTKYFFYFVSGVFITFEWRFLC